MESNITMYEYYEKKSGSQHNRRLIDGTVTGCGKCVGYCEYCEHSGFLTKEQRKQHDCIGKGCYYYIPKERTTIAKPIKESTPDTIKSIAQQVLSKLDYMKVVRAVQNGSNQWNLDFVTISNDQAHIGYVDTIEKKTGYSIKFRKLDWSFDRCANYICLPEK